MSELPPRVVRLLRRREIEFAINWFGFFTGIVFAAWGVYLSVTTPDANLFFKVIAFYVGMFLAFMQIDRNVWYKRVISLGEIIRESELEVESVNHTEYRLEDSSDDSTGEESEG